MTGLKQKSTTKVVREQERELKRRAQSQCRAERMMRRSELRLRQAQAALCDIRKICRRASTEASILATDLSALSAVSSELGHALVILTYAVPAFGCKLLSCGDGLLELRNGVDVISWRPSRMHTRRAT